MNFWSQMILVGGPNSYSALHTSTAPMCSSSSAICCPECNVEWWNQLFAKVRPCTTNWLLTHYSLVFLLNKRPFQLGGLSARHQKLEVWPGDAAQSYPVTRWRGTKSGVAMALSQSQPVTSWSSMEFHGVPHGRVPVPVRDLMITVCFALL